jgi:hypothetical protein
VAGGVGIAGIALWGVTGIWGLAQKSAASDAGGCDADGKCESAQAAEDVSPQPNTLLNVATVGLIVGALGLGTGAVLLVVAGGDDGERRTQARQNRARTLRIEPSVGPGTAGGIVTGRF